MSLCHRWAMLLVAFTAGCSVWRPLPGGGFAHPASEPLGRVRVVLRDGTLHELVDASVTPDSLMGLRRESLTRFAAERRNIACVEAPEPDGTRTFVAGALVPVVAAFLTLVALYALLATSGGMD